ncbi:MAG: hypothetical protein RLZZ399_1077 [Verrucomicrobiota bacterium]|jgi:hypothetical protein
MRGRKPLNQTGAAARIIRCWLGISVDKLVIDLEIAGHPICRSSTDRIESRQKYFTDVDMMAYVETLRIRADRLFMEPRELQKHLQTHLRERHQKALLRTNLMRIPHFRSRNREVFRPLDLHLSRDRDKRSPSLQ